MQALVGQDPAKRSGTRSAKRQEYVRCLLRLRSRGGCLELQQAGGAAAKLAAVESGREQCREELSKVGAELETARGEVETVKQRLEGCQA